MNETIAVVVTVVVVGLMANLNTGVIAGTLVAIERGFREGWAFVGGASAARVLMVLVGAGAVAATLSQLFGSLRLDRATYQLMLLAGLGVLLASVHEFIKPPPGVLELEASTEGKKAPGNVGAFFWSAFGLTIINLKQWIFTALVVTSIGSLGHDPAATVGLGLAFLAIASAFGLGLLLVRYMRPDKSDAVIERVDMWMKTHNRKIIAGIAALIGSGMMLVAGVALRG